MDRDNSGTIQLIGLEQQMEEASELALDIGRGDVLDTMTDRENDPVQSLLQPLNIPIPDPRNGMFTGAQSRVSPIRGRSPTAGQRNSSAADGQRFQRPPRLRIRRADQTDIHAPVFPTVVLDPDQLPDFYPSPIPTELTTASGAMSDTAITCDIDASHSASMLSAFDNRYDVYLYFHDPPVLPSLPPPLVQNSFLLWRQAILSIAAELDSGVSLSRVICLALQDGPQLLSQSQLQIQSQSQSQSQPQETLGDSTVTPEDGPGTVCGVVIDLLAIKRYSLPIRTTATPASSTATATAPSSTPAIVSNPVIFVRYAAIHRSPAAREAVMASAHDLPDNGACQKTVYCSHGEIAWALHTLAAQAGCVDEAYRRRWEEDNNNNSSSGSSSGSSSSSNSGSSSGSCRPHDSAQPDLMFLLSCLRPTDEPSFPFEEAEMIRRWERAQRKQERADIRLAREVQIAESKAACKRETAERRRLRGERQQREEEERLAAVRDGTVAGLDMNRTCELVGCEEVALLQCGVCHRASYCRVQRES